MHFCIDSENIDSNSGREFIDGRSSEETFGDAATIAWSRLVTADQAPLVEWAQSAFKERHRNGIHVEIPPRNGTDRQVKLKKAPS